MLDGMAGKVRKGIILKIVKLKSIEVKFIKLLPVFRDFVVSNTLIL